MEILMKIVLDFYVILDNLDLYLCLGFDFNCIILRFYLSFLFINLFNNILNT